MLAPFLGAEIEMQRYIIIRTKKIYKKVSYLVTFLKENKSNIMKA